MGIFILNSSFAIINLKSNYFLKKLVKTLSQLGLTEISTKIRYKWNSIKSKSG